jgi:carbonic anhydrase
MRDLMSVIDELVQANRRYAEGHEDRGAPARPARRVAVVTCMDARIMPAEMLGLDLGDAHVIRNAGGRTQEALRSLVISQRLLGTNEVMVIHHADCGMLDLSNDDVRAKVREDLGADDGGMDYLPFSGIRESVRDDVGLLRSSPLIGDDVVVRGFVYDERSGRVEEVA